MADFRSVEFVVKNSNKLISKNCNHQVESFFRQQHFAKRVFFIHIWQGQLFGSGGLFGDLQLKSLFFLFNEKNSKETQCSKKNQTLFH